MNYKFESAADRLRSNAEEIGLTPEVVSLDFALELVKELCDQLANSVTWGVEDFEQRAMENCDCEENNETWKETYDEGKFKKALSEMIRQHDCNNGITWDTINYYLDEYCKK